MSLFLVTARLIKRRISLLSSTIKKVMQTSSLEESESAFARTGLVPGLPRVNRLPAGRGDVRQSRTFSTQSQANDIAINTQFLLSRTAHLSG
jgi:hypothetical protein